MGYGCICLCGKYVNPCVHKGEMCVECCVSYNTDIVEVKYSRREMGVLWLSVDADVHSREVIAPGVRGHAAFTVRRQRVRDGGAQPPFCFSHTSGPQAVGGYRLQSCWV